MIGECVPESDRKYQCILLLLSCLSICMALTVTSEDAAILATLIRDHHGLFKEEYPEQGITPKMHYMVHFPSEIIQYSTLQMLFQTVL